MSIYGMRAVATVSAAILTVLAVGSLSAAQAETSDTGSSTREKTIVLPAEFLTTGRISVKTWTSPNAPWQPVRASIVCNSVAVTPYCMYTNAPENIARIRVVNPKTKEAEIYLVVRVEPGAPLAAIPIADIVDETYPAG